MRITSVQKFLPGALSISRTRGLKMTQWEKGGRILISQPPFLPARPFSKMAQDLEEKREEAGSPFVTPFPCLFFLMRATTLNHHEVVTKGTRSLLSSCLVTAPFSAGTFSDLFLQPPNKKWRPLLRDIISCGRVKRGSVPSKSKSSTAPVLCGL